MLILCGLFQEANPNVQLPVQQHGGGDVGTMVLLLYQSTSCTTGEPPLLYAGYHYFTASFMNLHVSPPPVFFIFVLLLSSWISSLRNLWFPLLCSVCAEETCAAASEAD
jgi:hypothetical protein